MKKIVRITTIPLSLEKLLEGQLGYMSSFYELTAISSEKERLEAYAKNENVAYFYLPLTRKITPIKDMRAVYKLYRYLQQTKPDILHTHTPKAGIVGMLAAHLAGVPIRLHTVAGLPLLEATGLKRMLLNGVEKLTYRFATRVYPNSFGLEQIILDHGFTKRTKLKVLGNGSSNGIDTSFFSQEHFSEDQINKKRIELGIPADHFVFVFVGRLVKDKGINELVNAFLHLQKAHEKCSLLLVGPFENELDPLKKSTVEAMESSTNIHNTGYQQDIRIYLSLSDVLVFPSYREGFPNVVMQAGAMGLPGIVSDINGCNEIISEKVNGLVIPVKNTVALHQAMQMLLTDSDLYAKLAAQSRRQIVSKYERSNLWKLLKDEYDTLLSNL